MSGSYLRVLLLLGAVTGLGWLGYSQLQGTRSQASEPLQPPTVDEWPGDDPNVVFSAPGITEPASRTIQLVSELPGTIRDIWVKSGDRMKKGQVLVELANDTQQAEVRQREALVRKAKANLAKLESWERAEDREIAKAQAEEATAMLRLAQFEQKRVEALIEQGAVSSKEIRNAQDQRMAAQARSEAAKARYERSIAGPSPEDLGVARATVAEAETQLQVAKTYLDKTYIRSPIDGIVLYRFREPGETVFPDVPSPILSIGDRDTLHLRADVDETDLERMRVGQRVFATADAFGSRRFPGTVVHIEQTMGRQNFRTDRPTEKVDIKILEVVIALDDGSCLPVDLQMTVWFVNSQDKKMSATTQPVANHQKSSRLSWHAQG